MDEAEALATAGAAHGTVVTADAQRAGRGRRGRQWAAPPGSGVNLSVILRPALEPALASPITLAAGIAVCDLVNSRGCESSIKWPNDVLVGGRKIAGVLTEMSTSGTKLDYVIMGIGINVTEVPAEVADIATALAHCGRATSADEVLRELLPGLERMLDRFFAGGVEAIADDWRARALLGVPVEGANGVRGRAIDLAPSGALVVKDSGGRCHHIVAGELSWG
ncbi:MAG: biotin--[acetyl-CoA-carboxylase] ligase [Deltaproteobacteria bacterium]|nr:biotin--[acetyl-CoA-carboxylase] ligase [Deltaproteobacteria bacterium]